MRRFWIPAFGVAMLLFFNGGVSLGNEADWFYQAAGIIERFEAIGAAKSTPEQTQLDYFQLLQDVSEFDAVGEDTPRAARARKVFALFMSRRIHEQLGDAAAMNRAAEEYTRERDAIPKPERLMFRLLFERTQGKATFCAPRVCEVEARGKEVRVTAVDYPIRALLEKMAEAAGEKIEIPPEVSGLVDYPEKDWKRIDHALWLFAKAHGLWVKGNVGKGFNTRVMDPLYSASLGERAEKHARKIKPERTTDGILRGYAILHGHYVPPPYNVVIRTEADRCKVLVNGVAIGKGYKLSDERGAPVAAAEGVQFEMTGKLADYVGRQFANMRAQHGKAEAKRQTIRFLKGQRIVKSFSFQDDDNNLEIVTNSGRSESIALYSFTPGRIKQTRESPDAKRKARERLRQEAEAYKKRAMEKAQKTKDRVLTTLREGGLVVLPSGANDALCYPAKKAREVLPGICGALQECERSRDQVSRLLFDPWADQASDCAWEAVFNLRHREVLQRLRSAEGKKAASVSFIDAALRAAQ